tara:strand:+ start:2326 stop:3114 length:789 start_codon:yes stop_codon:yes gene_type:complete
MLQYIKVISIVILSGCTPAVANQLYIEQAGASFDLDVVQDGQDNYLKLDIDGSNTTFNILQQGDNHKTSWISYWGSGAAWGGDIDGNGNEFEIKQINNQTNTSTGGTIGFHILGNSNSLALTQGCVYDNTSSSNCTSGSYEAANHVINVDVHGSNNALKLGQRSGNSDKHDMTVYTYGSSNNIFAKQKGTGEKDLYLRLNGDGHSVSSVQTGQGSHNASITLTKGAGAYSLSLTQHSDTTQNYSLTGTCQNSSGCGVTVTQN